MIWKGSTKNCMRSDSGYLISRYWYVDRYWYISRAPGHKILGRAESADEAKVLCEQAESGGEA